MKSINYQALTLEEDVILEIQIDGPSPKTQDDISEEGMSLIIKSVVINVQGFLLHILTKWIILNYI